MAEPDESIHCQLLGLLEIYAAEEGLDWRIGLRIIGQPEVIRDDIAHDIRPIEVVDKELAVLRVAFAFVSADRLPAALTKIFLTHFIAAWLKLRYGL